MTRPRMPPGPRHAGGLPASELLPGMETKSRGVVDLFKSEPLLTGHCGALLMKDVGCDYKSCPFCPKSLTELPRCDVGDIAAALRRCMGSSGARSSRPGTPRCERSNSVGSDRSVGSYAVMAVARSRNGSASERGAWRRRRPRTTRHITVRVTPNPSHQCRSRPRRVRRWSNTTRTQPPTQSTIASCQTRVTRRRLSWMAPSTTQTTAMSRCRLFSSSKTIAECDDVVRVAAFPALPIVEKEEPTEVDWAAATPPPGRWSKDLGDMFANNPARARTWDEVEAAMQRLVIYHAVRDTQRSLLSVTARRARRAAHARTRARTTLLADAAAAPTSPATKPVPTRAWASQTWSQLWPGSAPKSPN